jgi:hypothetical protein
MLRLLRLTRSPAAFALVATVVLGAPVNARSQAQASTHSAPVTPTKPTGLDAVDQGAWCAYLRPLATANAKPCPTCTRKEQAARQRAQAAFRHACSAQSVNRANSSPRVRKVTYGPDALASRTVVTAKPVRNRRSLITVRGSTGPLTIVLIKRDSTRQQWTYEKVEASSSKPAEFSVPGGTVSIGTRPNGYVAAAISSDDDAHANMCTADQIEGGYQEVDDQCILTGCGWSNGVGTCVDDGCTTLICEATPETPQPPALPPTAPCVSNCYARYEAAVRSCRNEALLHTVPEVIVVFLPGGPIVKAVELGGKLLGGPIIINEELNCFDRAYNNFEFCAHRCGSSDDDAAASFALSPNGAEVHSDRKGHQ